MSLMLWMAIHFKFLIMLDFIFTNPHPTPRYTVIYLKLGLLRLYYLCSTNQLNHFHYSTHQKFRLVNRKVALSLRR
jgi:hypothetical protein